MRDAKQYGYLSNFCYYGSGTECPEPFLIWSGLALLAAVAGRKIWYQHGDYFAIYPNIYVCMVGTAGSGKSSAMGLAEDIFVKHFPEYFVSESIQSREDLLKKMSSDTCVHTWQDAEGRYGLKGAIYEWRPFFCIVDELSNFVSVDKEKMIGTLVGIYSRNSFGTGFKNDANANQRFRNPYLTMLACTIPDWIMNSLRIDLFTGGLGRRLIIVHCKKEKLDEEPKVPEGGADALTEVIAHLQALSSPDVHGAMLMTPGAKQWWKTWYHDPKRFNKTDPILMQFHETKHVQLLKVATLLALCDRPFKLELDVHHLTGALAMLTTLEDDVVRLTSGIGRNELAGVGAQILDFIQRIGDGAVTRQALMKFFARYLRDPEFVELLNHYKQTNELIELVNPADGKTWYMLPDAYERYKEKVKPQ